MARHRQGLLDVVMMRVSCSDPLPATGAGQFSTVILTPELNVLPPEPETSDKRT